MGHLLICQPRLFPSVSALRLSLTSERRDASFRSLAPPLPDRRVNSHYCPRVVRGESRRFRARRGNRAALRRFAPLRSAIFSSCRFYEHSMYAAALVLFYSNFNSFNSTHCISEPFQVTAYNSAFLLGFGFLVDHRGFKMIAVPCAGRAPKKKNSNSSLATSSDGRSAKRRISICEVADFPSYFIFSLKK